jgi:hypothetical protein
MLLQRPGPQNSTELVAATSPSRRPVWAGGTVGRVLFSSARGLLADWVSAVIRKLTRPSPLY